jgi:hypothetical protein
MRIVNREEFFKVTTSLPLSPIVKNWWSSHIKEEVDDRSIKTVTENYENIQNCS